MYDQHIVLDFEMNPVAEENKDCRAHFYSEIIEIGAVKLNDRYEAADKFSCLVKPQLNDRIEQPIIRLTGITSADVGMSITFERALTAFSRWIGEGRTRIYSWGERDLADLKTECAVKNIAFPENMKRWMNFQPIYYRLMRADSRKRCISLERAAQWFGMTMDEDKAHRALYDAKVTARLVRSVLTGEYLKQVETLNKELNDRRELKVSMGDVCADAFAKLLEQLAADETNENEE